MSVNDLKEQLFREYIQDGNYAPGAKLPTVRELAKIFDVSGPTVGKAIEIMANDGWLTKRRGSGIYLSDKKPAAISSAGGKRTYRIGVIVSNMALELAHRVFEGVEFVVRQNDAVLEIANSIGLVREEKRQIEAMRARGVDGIVLYPIGWRTEEYLNTEFRDYPIVVVDLYTPEMNRPRIVFDNKLAGREMTLYLWAKGCRRIIFAKFDDHYVYPSVDARVEGYRQALKGLGCSDSDACILNCGGVVTSNWEPFEEHVEEMLARDPRPDAIIFPSDTFAHHAVQMLKAKGGTLAQEILVAGFDNLQVHHVENNWPTTKPDFVRIGELATEMLLQALRTGNLEAREMILPCPLLVSNAAKFRNLSYGSQYPYESHLTARSESVAVAAGK